MASTLLWPTDIPKIARVRMNTGFRSFATARVGNANRLLQQQCIRINDHAIATAERGSLEIDYGQSRYRIEEGCSVLLSNTTAVVTERTSPGHTEGTFNWFFFPDKVLAKRLPCDIDTFIAFHGFSIHSAPTEVIPLGSRLGQHAFALANGKCDQLLNAMIRLAFHEPRSAFLKLCLNRIITPRMRILIFLENFLLRPRSDHGSLFTRYPGGESALKREMSRLGMPSVASILARRRVELARFWNGTCGCTKEKIRKALHLNGGWRWDAHPRPERKEVNQQTCGLFDHPGSEWEGSQTEQAFEAQRFEESPTPFDVPTGQDTAFREMKDTGIRAFIEHKRIRKVPGLEDCDQLIIDMAAPLH